jgi:hypothetical protein
MKKPFFSNQAIGHCVCIDWDIFYHDFIQIAQTHTLVLIQTVREKTGCEIEAFYQESASGNVHLALRFNRDLSVLDAFLIRGWMGDDETRLRLDMARYLKTGSLWEMNRCFEHKIKVVQGQATLKSAGPWIRFDGSLKPEGTTGEAHTLISTMQKDRRHKKERQGNAENQNQIGTLG